MRDNEFKRREKEIGNRHLSQEQKETIKKLLAGNTSKRLINMMFGTSYQQLKTL